jgi:cob(I)alamin adenosyltransferase
MGGIAFGDHGGELLLETMGLVHVYYGDGKGKTTAALGLALRACGQGLCVTVLPFFKSAFSGEFAALDKLPYVNVLRVQGNGKFLPAMTQEEKECMRKEHDRLLMEAAVIAMRGECDLLVLDEALDAVSLSMADESILAGLLKNKPQGLEMVITGHQPIDWIMESADYITEMIKHKHPYDNGISARKGIEY